MFCGDGIRSQTMITRLTSGCNLCYRRVPAEAETFRDVVDMMPKQVKALDVATRSDVLVVRNVAHRTQPIMVFISSQNEVTELGGGINSDHILKDEDLDKCAESQHLAVVDTNIKVSAGAEGIESNICLKFPVSAEASRKTAEDLHASIDSPQHLDLSNSGVEEPEQLVSILQKEHVEERKECEHSSMRQNIQKKIVNQNMRERECILNFSVLDSKGKEDKLMEARAEKADSDLPENRDPKSKQFESEDCDTSAPSGDKKTCGHLQGRGCVEEAPHRVNLAGSSSSTAMEATENSRHIWEVAESERRELDTKPVVGEGNKENFWENGVVVDRVQASESERQMQECVVVESTMLTGRPVHSVPVEDPICPTKESPAGNYQETATKAKLNRSENSSEKQVKEAKSRCKTIASLLTASPNPNSRGVLMFKKRRQRAKKFTLTSFGNIEKVACAGASEGTDEDSLPTTSESELEEEEDIKERRKADRSKFESIRSVPEIVPHLVTEAKLESDFGNLEDTAMMVQQNLEKTQMCNGTTEAQSDEWVFYGIDESGAAVLNNAEQAQTRTAEMESPQLQQIHSQISQRSQCKETHEEGNQQVTVGKTPHSNAMTLPCSDYQSTHFQAYGLGTLSNVTLKAPLSCTSTTGGIKCIPALQVLNRTARPFTPGVAQEAAGTPLSPLSQRSKQIQAMQPQSHGKGFPSEQATQNSERICNNSIPGTVSTKVQNAKTTSSKHCTSQKPAAPIQTNVELQVQPLASAVRMHHPATPLQKHTHEALSTSQDVPRTIKVDSGIKEPQQTQRSSSHPICPSSVSKSILTSSLSRNVFPDRDDKPAMITSLHLSDSPSPQKDPTSDGSTVTPFSPEPPPEISSREQRIIIPAACTGILQEVKKRNARQPDKTKMFTFKEVQKNSPNPELLSLVQNLDDKGKGLDVEHEDDSLGLGAEAANFSQVHKANKSPPPVAPKPVTMTHQDSPKIYNSHSTPVSPGTAHNCAPAIGSPLAQSVAESYTFGATTRVGPSLAKKITPPPSPSVLSCRIAEMKGKGAKLFAKCQNRMERFVVGNIPEDLMVNGRGPSPTPSLPASWKYSSQIRAPPPICYNPILSPFYPPAAAAKGTQGGGMTMTATRPPGKGKGGSKCKMEKMEIMKHQPYQLNSAMFTYSSKNTAKVKAVPQMPASTQPVAEPCGSYSNVHQKPPVSVTSQLQMEVRGVPASQNVNSESAIIILPQKQQDCQSTVPVQSPSLIQKQAHFGHLQNQSQRSVPCITTRQGPVTAIVSPVKATTTDERQLGRVGPTPFLVGLDHSARQSPSLYQAPRPSFSAKASGVKPHVWQPQAGQP